MDRIPIISSAQGEAAKPTKRGRDFIHGLLNVLTTPQQALVGVVEETQRREQGLAPQSFVEAAKTGMKEDYDWRQIFGDTPAATISNFVLDPVNLTALPGFSAAVEGATKATAGAIGKGLGKSATMRKIGGELGEMFVPDYHARHVLGMPELAEARAARTKRLRELTAEYRDPRSVEVDRLLPTLESKKKVFRLAEEPMTGGTPEHEKWKAAVEALHPKEKKALQIFRGFIQEKEDEKIAGGLINDLIADGVQAKSGVSYVPRFLAGPKEAAAALRKEAEVVDAQAQKIVGTSRREVRTKGLLAGRSKQLKDAALEYEGMSPNTLRERLMQADAKIRTPRFLKSRKLGALNNIGHLSEMFDQDVARVMEKERIDVARALADREYMENVVNFMKGRGWTKTADEAAKLDGYEQLVKHERFPGFNDVYVPKEVAKEAGKVVEKMQDPVFAPTIFSLFRRITQAWKGTTLFYAPEFYTRQAVNNVALNHLAGMPLHEFMGHNVAGIKYAKKFIIDGAKASDDIVMKTKAYPRGLTERDLQRAFTREGALGHGIVGEIDDYLKSPNAGKSKMARMVDYVSRDNPIMTRGIKALNAIDGQAKVAHMLWRLSKGDTIEVAGKSMRKFLYDPDTILTPFEKKYLRDFAAPFWGWVKFNMPLQIEMISHYPSRVATQVKAMNEVENYIGGPDPEEQFLPAWMRNASKMRIRWDEDTKTWQFLTLASWYPTAELEKTDPHNARLAQELWNLLTPIVKEPAEWASGYQLNFLPPTKIERFPGEKGEVLGIPMRRRFEAAVKFLRPINIADKTMKAYSSEVSKTEANRIQSALYQLAFGRVYSMNQADMKKKWESNLDFRIREMKGIRNSYVKKGDKGNAEEAEQIIKELETSKRMLQGHK